MKIRLYNARILTLDNSFEIKRGEVWTEDDRVVYIGEKKQDMPLFDREIDVNDNLLMPSFKNAHTHSAMTFLRGYAEDMPLEQWLNEGVFPMEARLSEGDCYAFSKVAMLEYIEGGISACMDMYNFEEDNVRAAADCGVRIVLSGPLNNFVGSVEKEKAFFERFNGNNSLVSKKLGFHAVYTTDEVILRQLATAANEFNTQVCTHCSETKTEVENCLKATGKTPFEYLDSLGLFSNGGTIYHGVYLTDKEIEIIKAKNVSVVTCPASNLKLASGIAPLCKLLKAGVNVGIGTDGPASNNSLDMFREMYLAAVLQKYSTGDAKAMRAEDVLYMATVGGSRAMGLLDCDVLREGKKADIIMLDLQKPNMQPENDIVKNIVYSGSKKNVKMTMIDGKIIYMNGEFFLNESTREIYALAKKAKEDLRGRNNG